MARFVKIMFVLVPTITSLFPYMAVAEFGINENLGET